MPSNAHDKTRPAEALPLTDGLEEILAKSCELMAKRGYDGTSMRDLAQETGRSLSGLYHYFGSKEELLFLINYHGFTRLNNAWERIAEGLTNADQRLFAFVYFHLTYFVQHMDEMRVMTWGTRDMESDKARMVHELKDRYANHATAILLDRWSSHKGSNGDSKRAERHTYLLFGMMNWIFGWYTPRKHGGLTDLIDDVYVSCTHGFACAAPDSAQLSSWHDTIGNLYVKAIAHGAWGRSPVIDRVNARNPRRG